MKTTFFKTVWGNIVCVVIGAILGAASLYWYMNHSAETITQETPEYVSISDYLGKVATLGKHHIPHALIKHPELYKATLGRPVETHTQIVLEEKLVEVLVPVYVSAPSDGVYKLSFDTAELEDDTLGISGSIILDHYDIREASLLEAILTKDKETTVIELAKVATEDGYEWYISHDNPNVVIKDFSVVEKDTSQDWAVYLGAVLNDDINLGISLGGGRNNLGDIFGASLGFYGDIDYYFSGEISIESGVVLTF